jgi:hypothetical protein
MKRASFKVKPIIFSIEGHRLQVKCTGFSPYVTSSQKEPGLQPLRESLLLQSHSLPGNDEQNRAILAAMENLEAYYGKTATHYTLNWAILSLLLWAFMGCLGILRVVAPIPGHGGSWLFSAGYLLLGVVGIFNSVQIIHAVVRRLIAESRTTPNH